MSRGISLYVNLDGCEVVMEQLKKALDEANKIRSDAAHYAGKSFSTDTSFSLGSREAAQVCYSQTRVTPLNNAHLEEHRIICGRESIAVQQSYKLLRTQVLQKLSVNDWNSIAVVSPTSGNGKTTTAINLAISLAKEVKQTVLLVDFDFQSPSIARYLGIKLKHDIGDYLFRDADLSSVLVNPDIERLVVLGGHTQLNHSSELLSSPKLLKLVDELKSRYADRIVIFDLPPMLEFDDAIAFIPNVDAVLMVVEEGATTADDLERCSQQLDAKPLLGTLLNKGKA